jgi:hypothetical protein
MAQLLRIKTLSWDKQQYELFDNESNTYLQNGYSVNGAGFLYRNSNDNQIMYSQGFESIKNYHPEVSDHKVLMAFQEMNSTSCQTRCRLFPDWIAQVPPRAGN